MTHFSFAAMLHRGRLVLALPIFLEVAAPAAHAQGRGVHPRPFATPFMMRPTTPVMRPTPFARSNFNTNTLLRRDGRLDSMLARDLRFDHLLGRNLGPSPFGGTWGGGFAGSGLLAIPVGGTVGTTNTLAPKEPEQTESSARAALLLEKALTARLDNRRQAFDELQYERDRTPSPEQEMLSRSRGNPPRAEVLSGQALNALLDDLRATADGPANVDRPNPRLPLDSRETQHINVTRGGGSIALLKDGGRLTWPAALAGPAFREPRDRLTAQAAQAVRQASSTGRVDPAAIRQMAADTSELRALLRQNSKGLSFQTFIEARDFLQQFNDALVVLGRPDAAEFFNGTYDVNAETVFGLVKQMTDRGLRFAPAAPGDEATYAALWAALAAADRAAVKSVVTMH